jgi:hypothetical protein
MCACAAPAWARLDAEEVAWTTRVWHEFRGSAAALAKLMAAASSLPDLLLQRRQAGAPVRSAVHRFAQPVEPVP